MVFAFRFLLQWDASLALFITARRLDLMVEKFYLYAVRFGTSPALPRFELNTSAQVGMRARLSHNSGDKGVLRSVCSMTRRITEKKMGELLHVLHCRYDP